GIRDFHVTGVQTCALPILCRLAPRGLPAPGRERLPRRNRRPAAARLPPYLALAPAGPSATPAHPAVARTGGAGAQPAPALGPGQIGRASCRERGWGRGEGV